VILRRILFACCLLLAACSSTPPPPPISWTEATLPIPAGTPGRLTVLDAADCDGLWYVVGGVLGAGDATRPAAWTSTDGHTWRSMTFAPLPGSFYGPQDLISSVACAGGRVAMIGAKPGGAHGIPRVSTWRLAGGRLDEVGAPFETYGGDRAVNVAHVAAGPAGFLITGNRTSGAAVWLSADGANFRLFEDAPGLADDATHQTAARDAVAAADGQWVIVGGSAPKNSADEAPAVWLTRDGSGFARAAVPAKPGYNELERVVRVGADIVAVGPRGSSLGAWRSPEAGPGRGWREDGTFGRSTDGVQALAVAGGRLIAASGGTLWRSADGGGSWTSLSPPAGAGTALAVAGGPQAVLVAGAGRVWTAPAAG
jgi:hypothetical protein